MQRQPKKTSIHCPSRRSFLKHGGHTAIGLGAWSMGSQHLQGADASQAASLNRPGGPIPRPDLLDENSPSGIEVFQLTSEPEVPSSHVYMEAQIFTPDSKRLVLHRSAHAHGSNKEDPNHQYLLCDLENQYALAPLTTEVGATGPSISPDGRYLYYFVNETEVGGGRLTLRRVGLDGADRQTLVVIDSPLPGTKYRPSQIYPLSTISSDGKRLATAAFLGDGNTPDAPYGLLVFHVEKGQVDLVVEGPSWCNLHPQYCRSLDPDASHDILIQENHGNVGLPSGKITRLTGGKGADIHVIRDDGSNFRTMPWGRDGNEFCQGHQCWRGRDTWAITSTGTREPREHQLIEGRAVAHTGHLGITTPDGVRNDLSREFPDPHFCHFATDIAGQRLVSDSTPLTEGGRLYLTQLGRPGRDSATEFIYLLNPKSTGDKTAHVHPFLSPDGSMAFFNSDESGILQTYMIRGLDACFA